ncbi:hypothetical protein [Haladaptatus sp. NG-SE-30]
MSSIRCSNLTALFLVLALALSAVVPAAAVSTDQQGVPNDATVGEKVTATVTLTDLYGEYEQWMLDGATQLTDVTWTVTTYDQAGNQKDKQSYDGQSFNHSLSLDSDASKVSVEVTGKVPEVENFSYENQQAFTVAELSQSREGGNSDVIETWTANHHTDESKDARATIVAAQQSIDSAPKGADTSDAEGTLDDAITAYNGENFELAGNLADKAKENANSATKQAEKSAQTSKLLMYGGTALLALIVIGGAAYWYRSQQQNNYRLR